eukprot:TRINITY_DN88325_c0_g1_i1.p1 TRINITY_DN88325_c0_g1~~TRINITY_DN88325_c0_g1_i1.p1  ORF type:complete len:241 (-),score=13.12 TRINITY_DN88325_c0_g1_i1:74-796(-)
MGKTYPCIEPSVRDFIMNSPMFFVGSAPLQGKFINISPKGMDGTFAIIDDHTVAYLESFGSGIETLSHLRENGRIVLMFASFVGTPKIMRLHGTGVGHLQGSAEYKRLLKEHFGKFSDKWPEVADHMRSIILVNVKRVSDSCGFGVPEMEYKQDREILLNSYSERKLGSANPNKQRLEWTRERNRYSLDGLPGAIPDVGTGVNWVPRNYAKEGLQWVSRNAVPLMLGVGIGVAAMRYSKN